MRASAAVAPDVLHLDHESVPLACRPGVPMHIKAAREGDGAVHWEIRGARLYLCHGHDAQRVVQAEATWVSSVLHARGRDEDLFFDVRGGVVVARWSVENHLPAPGRATEPGC